MANSKISSGVINSHINPDSLYSFLSHLTTAPKFIGNVFILSDTLKN